MRRSSLYIALITSAIMLFPVFVRGQLGKDTLRLQEIEIKSSSFSVKNEGFKKVRIDSSLLVPQLNVSLSTLLSQHTTVFLKSYGNGSLATPSMRGSTAGHVEVQWNGISINSPMLGMTDFSHIPVFEFSSIEILYGAAGIQKTGGAFGGVINLVTNPEWNNRLKVTAALTMESFDTYTDNLSVSAGNEKFQSISKIYYKYSKNNFPYKDLNLETKTQQNGEYTYADGSEELFFRLGKKDFITTRLWYNYAFVNIPPTLTSTITDYKETQENNDLYSKVEWSHLGKNNLLTVWSGFVDQNMTYVDPLLAEASRYSSNSWLNRLRWSYTGLKKFFIKPGIDYNYDWVISAGYTDTKTRSFVAGFSEFILKYPEKFSFNLIIRQEYLDDHFLPLIAAIGGEYDPLKSHNLSFSVNFAKNYKYPTLNDLYYENYGNPDLKPETDYSAEAGVNYHLLNINKARTQFFVEAELTGYYSKMIDLIIWTPGFDGKFRPSNFAEVIARGIETGLNFKYQRKNFNLSLKNNYHFCKSTNENSDSPGSQGKQIIYIPVHTFNTTLSAGFYGYNFSYNFSWVSRRYTSTDNSSYMEPYGISNIILGKNFELEEMLLSLQLQINNLFDLDYQSIANRPMQGRNAAFTLKFNFGK